jgi:general secretion pathway protein A
LTICEELGIGVPDTATESLKDLVDILSGYLLRAHANGRRVVVVVDEAQNLAPTVLEQVRLLTNLETNTRKLLQIILIGQPELRELLARNELRQLAQRITGRYHLNPLTQEETSAYVRHRLRVAGATSDIFSPAALAEVHRLAGGVPRVINVVCDRALLGAYSMDRHHVTASLVRNAASEVFGRRFTPHWVPWIGAAAAAALLVMTTALIWRFKPWKSSSPPRPPVAVAAAMPAPTKPAADERIAAIVRPAPSGHELADLLSRYSAETDTDSAFSKLFGIWRIQYMPASVDPCSQASNRGLECLTQKGSFGQLRLYNRPAILMLNDDAGTPHQVVLTKLDDEHASIELGGSSHEISIGELSRYWFGDFVMLWRPGTTQVKSLSEGMRGDDVRWLRQSLQRVEGAHSEGPVSDVFDADLSKLVRDFQRQHRLTVDGIAGVQTQVVLASAVAPPDAPSLYLADAHGS